MTDGNTYALPETATELEQAKVKIVELEAKLAEMEGEAE